MATHDGGNTWAAHVLGTTDEMQAISCPIPNTCFAVGWPGAIYFTGDGGTTWTLQANVLYGSDNTLLGVSCASATSCVAVGTTGVVLSTSNGTTWGAESSGTAANLFSVSCPSTVTCVAVGSNGLAAIRNAGTWQPVASGQPHTLLGVSCPYVGTCYAVGAAGSIVATTSFGHSWSVRGSGTTADLYAVSCLNSTECAAVGSFGTAVSTANGSLWSTLAPPTFNSLRAVAFKDPTHIWLAGYGGTILSEPSCTSATLQSSVPSPKPGGTQVMFTAAGIGSGCTAPQYEFWTYSTTSGWKMQRPYSPDPQWTFDTTGIAPGTVTVDAWVEQFGSSLGTGNYETFGLESWVVTGCESATLTPNPAPTTGSITFIATVGGTDCDHPQYQFYLYSVAAGWQLKQAYSGTNTWMVNADLLAAGTYSVDVWVKQLNSPAQYETWALSTIPKGACGSNATTTITPTQASPQVVGGTIHLSTATTCGVAPAYKYWLFPGTAGSWQTLGATTPTAASTGVPAATRPAHRASWCTSPRQMPTNPNQAPDTWGLLSYTLAGCPTVALAASPLSPQPPGTLVTMTGTASVTCGAPLYQFWYYPPGGPWHWSRISARTRASHGTRPDSRPGHTPGSFTSGRPVLETHSIRTRCSAIPSADAGRASRRHATEV